MNQKLNLFIINEIFTFYVDSISLIQEKKMDLNLGIGKLLY